MPTTHTRIERATEIEQRRLTIVRVYTP